MPVNEDSQRGVKEAGFEEMGVRKTKGRGKEKGTEKRQSERQIHEKENCVDWYGRFLVWAFWCSVGALIWGNLWNHSSWGSGVEPAFQMECLAEMDEVKFAENWKFRVELSHEKKRIFQEKWYEKFGAVKEFLTAERVREMSRWSRKEMKNYRYVTLPDPELVRWETIAHDAKKNRFLRKAVLGSLPSEYGMKRELTVSAVFDVRTDEISWIGFSILSQIHLEEARGWFF